MFTLISDTRVTPTLEATPLLKRLHDYWDRCRGTRRMPRREDIDPAEIRTILKRIHLLDVISPTTFRYRVYGSNVSNPDARDMTGLTTADYRDTQFGEMVTRHLADVVREAAPICLHVRATLERQPYEYYRLTLPLSPDDERVSMLLVGSQRITLPLHLMR